MMMDVLRFSPHLCVGFLFLVLCPVCVRLLRLRAVTPTCSELSFACRRGTWWHRCCFCVTDVALMALGWLWWRVWPPVVQLWPNVGRSTCIVWFMPLCVCWLRFVFEHVCVALHVLLRAPVPSRAAYCRLSPRWPVVRDAAGLCAWGQRLVRNQVWQQGRWANAPCWAHIEALAGQFASLWLPNVPPCF